MAKYVIRRDIPATGNVMPEPRARSRGIAQGVLNDLG